MTSLLRKSDEVDFYLLRDGLSYSRSMRCSKDVDSFLVCSPDLGARNMPVEAARYGRSPCTLKHNTSDSTRLH